MANEYRTTIVDYPDENFCSIELEVNEEIVARAYRNEKYEWFLEIFKLPNGLTIELEAMQWFLGYAKEELEKYKPIED